VFAAQVACGPDRLRLGRFTEHGMMTQRSPAIHGLLSAVVLAVLLAGPAVVRGDCGCGAECQCGPGCTCGVWHDPPPPGPDARRVRKNQSSLTAQERQNFVDAVKQLKATFHPGATISIYDEYVHTHMMGMQTGSIHEGPVFFPWHRIFLRDFELELQAINPAVSLPYWDFSIDNQPDSSLWDDDFLGGDGDPGAGNVVLDGPFRQGEWKLIFDGPDLRREFGFFVPTLPTPDNVAGAFLIGEYDVPPYDVGSDITHSFRNYVVGWNWPTAEPEMHNRVHNWVGGSMLEMTSPNDPVFWLLHANLDRLWADWEAMYGYLYPDGDAPPGQNLHDVMNPFGVTPADVLNHRALGYRYDTEAGLALPPPRPIAADPGND
jgi:tyrosinase